MSAVNPVLQDSTRVMNIVSEEGEGNQEVIMSPSDYNDRAATLVPQLSNHNKHRPQYANSRDEDNN